MSYPRRLRSPDLGGNAASPPASASERRLQSPPHSTPEAGTPQPPRLAFRYNGRPSYTLGNQDQDEPHPSVSVRNHLRWHGSQLARTPRLRADDLSPTQRR